MSTNSEPIARLKKQCATCPFLEANRGRPTPTNHNCAGEPQNDWYEQYNIDGVWEVTRKVDYAFLSCHSTDPDYFGKPGQQVQGCAGVVALLFMQSVIWNLIPDEPTYNKVVGPFAAIDKMLLKRKMEMVLRGYTMFDGEKILLSPEITFDYSLLRYPKGWQNVIHVYDRALPLVQKVANEERQKQDN